MFNQSKDPYEIQAGDRILQLELLKEIDPLPTRHIPSVNHEDETNQSHLSIKFSHTFWAFPKLNLLLNKKTI